MTATISQRIALQSLTCTCCSADVFRDNTIPHYGMCWECQMVIPEQRADRVGMHGVSDHCHWVAGMEAAGYDAMQIKAQLVRRLATGQDMTATTTCLAAHDHDLYDGTGDISVHGTEITPDQAIAILVAHTPSPVLWSQRPVEVGDEVIINTDCDPDLPYGTRGYVVKVELEESTGAPYWLLVYAHGIVGEFSTDDIVETGI